MNDTQQPRSALVFGARNLGRAVVEGLRADGWAVAAVARSESTLETAEAAGALAMTGDVTDPDSVRATLARPPAETTARSTSSSTPASAYGGTRSGPFGGGPLAEAAPTPSTPGRPRPAAPRSPSSRRRRSPVDQARPATLIQVTGGSSRRAMPGRGLWAAGAFGVRAITQAAALELRGQGIHVALLIVDAGIEPLDGSVAPGADPAALADPRRIADAVAFLAEQGARAATHELQVTPLAETWVPWSPPTRCTPSGSSLDRFAADGPRRAGRHPSPTTSRATSIGTRAPRPRCARCSIARSTARRSSPRATASASPPSCARAAS